MPFSLTPDRMFDCYAQITPTFLRQQGITLLLSDLDFTLAAKRPAARISRCGTGSRR